MQNPIAIQIAGNDLFNETTLNSIREAGFDGVAISYYGKNNVLDTENWRDRVREQRRMAEAYGLQVVQTHLPCYDIMLSSECPNGASADRIRRGIEATALLGAQSGAWHPRTSFNFHFSTRRAFEDNLRELKSFLPDLQANGVTLCVENLPVFPSARDVLFYTNDYHDLIDVVDAMDSPYIAACWDTGHANLMKFSQSAAIREMGARIRILHLNSNLGNADVHFTPSFGTVPWGEVIPALGEIGYNGWFTLEVSLPTPETMHHYLMHCGESVRVLQRMAGEK